MSPRTLVFIPTYNERDNAENMARAILALGLDADLLFMDDASPDGTGEILDNLAQGQPRVRVLHRSGKLGIGSAHLEGIRWAYDRGYERLITLDCDFTHAPADVLRLVECSKDYDVTAGSRYLRKNSLPGWNLMRKALTGVGHFLTKNILGVDVDATGALRVYNLRRIPRETFDLVSARGYAFFFESMFILIRNGFSVGELAIALPARTYGSSKMTWREARRSAFRLLWLRAESIRTPGRFKVVSLIPAESNPLLVDPQGWDAYWNKKERPAAAAYEAIAAFYRVSVIKPQLERAIFRNFRTGAHLLHAGCGSGQVDIALQRRMKITAIDISPVALRIYRRNNPAAVAVEHASILDLPFAAATFEGVYNLGVMEHFTEDEIRRILAQFFSVLKPGGKLVIFWPHARATSVAVLGSAHWMLNNVLRKPIELHPPEISLLRSRDWAEPFFNEAGFRLVDYSFGMRDFFVQAILVAEKPGPSA